jgi:hypothetical protein
MKTLAVSLLLSFFGVAALASGEGTVDYLITKEGKVYVTELHFGLVNIKGILPDGQQVKVKYKDVVSYNRNGQIFDLKPLYVGDKDSGDRVFMQLICRKNGYTLYKYEEPVGGGQGQSRYFVFHDNDVYWLEVNRKNQKNICKFFLNQ